MIFFVFTAFCAQGQKPDNGRINSEKFKNDSLKVKDFLRIGRDTYLYTSPDSANLFAFQALLIADSINLQNEKAEAYRLIGSVAWTKGDFTTAFSNYEKALDIFEKQNNKQGTANTIGNIGLIFKEIRDYSASRRHHFKALALQVELQNIERQGITLHNIAETYLEENNFSLAIKFFRESEIKLKQTANKGVLAHTYAKLGSIFSKQGNSHEAMKYLSKAIEILATINNNFVKTLIYNEISSVYLSKNDFIQAEHFALQALQLSITSRLRLRRLECYRLLANLYYIKQDYKSSADFLKKQQLLNDSIYNESISNKIIKTKNEYDIAEQEKKLEKLQNEKEITDLNLKTTRISRNALIGLLMLISLLLYMIWWNNKTKLKDNKLLQLKNKEIERKNKQLEEANAHQSSILEIVSHDVKTPFVKISGLAYLISLEKNRLSKDQEKYLQYINDTVTDGVRILENVFDVTAIEAHKIQVELSTIDIEKVLHIVYQEYFQTALNKGITLKLTHNNQRKEVYSNSSLAERIFDNLLMNAIKYSMPNTDISILVDENPQGIVVSFMDNGQGILEEEQQFLFKKNKKISTRTTSGESCTGLGLYIVKSFADSINAKVTFSSQVGKGSTFSVFFPFTQSKVV